MPGMGVQPRRGTGVMDWHPTTEPLDSVSFAPKGRAHVPLHRDGGIRACELIGSTDQDPFTSAGASSIAPTPDPFASIPERRDPRQMLPLPG